MRRYLTLLHNEVISPAVIGIRGVSWRNPRLILKNLYNHFSSDSLYRNSIYLMISTIIGAFFGFLFWIIAARIFKPEEIGLATTLIAIATLIGNLSIVGIHIGLVRYLHQSKNKDVLINTSFSLVTLTSLVVALVYLSFIGIFSPKLAFIRENVLYSVMFVLCVIFFTLNLVIENIFVAYRMAKFVLLKNTILSILKLCLLYFLVFFGSYGIFMSYGLSFVITFLLSFVLLMRRFKFIFKPVLAVKSISKMLKFSFVNYAAGFIGSSSGYLLPILITNNLGPKESAYFYISMMIANVIFIIPQATAQSLLAEGAYDMNFLKEKIIKSIKIVLCFLVPSILFIIFFGNFILSVFGKSYQTDALRFLQLISVSAIFIAVDYIGYTIFRIRHQMKLLILINIFSSILILGSCYLFMHLGLVGVGFGWLLGNFFVALIYVVLLGKSLLRGS